MCPEPPVKSSRLCKRRVLKTPLLPPSLYNLSSFLMHNPLPHHSTMLRSVRYAGHTPTPPRTWCKHPHHTKHPVLPCVDGVGDLNAPCWHLGFRVYLLLLQRECLHLFLSLSVQLAVFAVTLVPFVRRPCVPELRSARRLFVSVHAVCLFPPIDCRIREHQWHRAM